METYKICGGKKLMGKIYVNGSKNALLPILASSILCKDIVTLENVSPLEDTYSMIEILKLLNVNVMYDNKSKMIIDSRSITNQVIMEEYTSKLRASYYFMGALLSLYNNVKIGHPGGCKFSARPIDLHFFAFENLGIKIAEIKNVYRLKKTNKSAQVIRFPKVSVGATINTILACVKNKGVVILENVAKEPEVDELISFLNRSGAVIKRDDNKIIVEGVKKLHGCHYTIMDDRIEAQTFIIIGALVGRNLEVIFNCKQYISEFLKLMRDLGVDIRYTNKGILVSETKEIKSRDLIFDVYPSLPTDIQPVLAILFSISKGESSFIDKVYPDRFSQVDELVSMGYNLKVNGEKLVIRKNNKYLDSVVECKDLRGGISLVVAALLSDKTTCVENVKHIKRGYYNIVYKLKKVGADIEEI